MRDPLLLVLRRWGRWLLPGACALCGAAPAANLCTACATSLPRVGRSCPRCARPAEHAGVCAGCRRAPPPFAAATSVLLYRPPVVELVHRLKFGGELGIAGVLAAALAERVDAGLRAGSIEVPEGLVAVPLHPARLRQRGFNQSAEIARLLAARLALPVLRGCSRRVVATAPQSAQASTRARRENLAGAFRSDPRLLAGRHLAIVDDVLTSGATAAALTRSLRAAGAARVDVWACARAEAAGAGPRRRDSRPTGRWPR